MEENVHPKTDELGLTAVFLIRVHIEVHRSRNVLDSDQEHTYTQRSRMYPFHRRVRDANTVE